MCHEFIMNILFRFWSKDFKDLKDSAIAFVPFDPLNP